MSPLSAGMGPAQHACQVHVPTGSAECEQTCATFTMVLVDHINHIIQHRQTRPDRPSCKVSSALCNGDQLDRLIELEISSYLSKIYASPIDGLLCHYMSGLKALSICWSGKCLLNPAQITKTEFETSSDWLNGIDLHDCLWEQLPHDTLQCMQGLQGSLARMHELQELATGRQRRGEKRGGEGGLRTLPLTMGFEPGKVKDLLKL